jgi:hypothetical protein
MVSTQFMTQLNVLLSAPKHFKLYYAGILLRNLEKSLDFFLEKMFLNVLRITKEIKYIKIQLSRYFFKVVIQ